MYLRYINEPIQIAFASNKLQMYKDWDPAINDLLNKLKLDSVSSTIE